MKYDRCKRCKFVGVRTSFVERSGLIHFLDKDVKAYDDVFEIFPSKMNEPETFEDFKARTYTRLKPVTP